MREKNFGIGSKIVIVVILAVIVLLSVFGCGPRNDYERAGREFGTWINEDPSTWTDTERKYFNDFLEWADKN